MLGQVAQKTGDMVQTLGEPIHRSNEEFKKRNVFPASSGPSP